MLEERYGLVRGFSDADAGLAAAEALVESLDEDMRALWHQRSLEHLHDSVDVVDYVVDILLSNHSR